MASASMNDIKARIKSVQSTMQITKAMELVATSKLRRAKERAENARPYRDMLSNAIFDIEATGKAKLSPWSEKRQEPKTLYIAIAGDRGLAGGYNSSIFKITDTLSHDQKTSVLPIGKKALEYFGRKREIFSRDYEYASDFGVGEAMRIGDAVCEAFAEGKIDRVVLVYTKFVSMMTQLPVYEELLPFESDEGAGERDAVYDGDSDELLSSIVPQYVGGIIYASVCEAIASESASRRSAMNSANKNAGEIIDTLMLGYNRARQSVITQEITEIVSGAEALG